MKSGPWACSLHTCLTLCMGFMMIPLITESGSSHEVFSKHLPFYYSTRKEGATVSYCVLGIAWSSWLSPLQDRRHSLCWAPGTLRSKMGSNLPRVPVGAELPAQTQLWHPCIDRSALTERKGVSGSVDHSLSVVFSVLVSRQYLGKKCNIYFKKSDLRLTEVFSYFCSINVLPKWLKIHN